MKVAVLGASADPRRYAFRAVHQLRAGGHEVIGVNPRLPDLGPVAVVGTVAELPDDIDTLTVYVAPERSAAMAEELVAKPFRRVIFNPGSENPELAGRLAAHHVAVVEACTLVLLATRQFDHDAP